MKKVCCSTEQMKHMEQKTSDGAAGADFCLWSSFSPVERFFDFGAVFRLWNDFSTLEKFSTNFQ
jgi:hypothetical protein